MLPVRARRTNRRRRIDHGRIDPTWLAWSKLSVLTGHVVFFQAMRWPSLGSMSNQHPETDLATKR